MDISYQQVWGSLYMVINVPQPQLLDDLSINNIQQKNPKFLLPVTVSNLNNNTVLMYRVAEQTENVRYMDTRVSMHQSSNLLLNMIGILVHLKNWNLDYHKIFFDGRSIYLNKVSGKVYFTYIPMKDYSVSDMEIKQNLYSIANNFTIYDDAHGKQKLLQCFTNDVTLEELYQRVLTVCNGGIPRVNTVSSQSQSQVQPQSQSQVQSQSQTFYLELIASEMPGVPNRILLDPQKSSMVIGRDSQSAEQPDIVFPSECKGIGRKHAKIEYRTGNFYLIDMNSVNHTYLNGQQLNPEQSYVLQPGSEIIFTKTKPVRYRMVKE